MLRKEIKKHRKNLKTSKKRKSTKKEIKKKYKNNRQLKNTKKSSPNIYIYIVYINTHIYSIYVYVCELDY